MDLPLYKIDLGSARTNSTDVLRESSLNASSAEGIEVLAGKVVKYLFTLKGSDALDPEYGSTLLQYTQVSKNELPRLQLELINALAACKNLIKATEGGIEDPSIKLRSLQLLKLVYNSGGIRDQVDIYIKITSMSGTDALLDVPLGRRRIRTEQEGDLN